MDRDDFAKRVTRRLYRDGTLGPTEAVVLAASECDLSATYICGWLGHSLEGRLAVMADSKVRLLGRCQRCGIGALTDGS